MSICIAYLIGILYSLYYDLIRSLTRLECSQAARREEGKSHLYINIMWNKRLIRLFSDKITPKAHEILTVNLMEPKSVSDILVSIPEKGALWGKGGQFVKTRNSKIHSVQFRRGQFPSLKRIQRFLENEQGRDIKIYDLRELAPNSPCTTAIAVSAYSIKHVGKLNNALVKEVESK
jgi:hypothetical protein